VPPISPIMMMPSVSSSAVEQLETSMKLVPLTGSPPMPMQVVWPRPVAVAAHGLVGQRAGARDDADLAALVDVAGHDADLAFVGRDDAGAVRADQRGLGALASARLTLTMSSTGMPSVMQTISGISASIASRIASAAKGGGT
jgi:hypothetical protein